MSIKKMLLLRRVLTIACCVICFKAQAQYVPNNAQVFQFAPILNPAFSGIENFSDLKLSYRYQWTGFGDNSPKFINVSYNTRLKQPVDLSYNSLRLSNPSLMRVPRLKRSIHGLSGQIFQSTIGVINTIGGGVTYGFHYPLTTALHLSFGAGAIIESRKLDMSEITVRDPDNDTYYNHLLNSSTSQTDLNVRAGFLLYSKTFYIGATYLPLVHTSIESSELSFEEAFYTGALQAGVAFQLNPNLALKPSVNLFYLLDESIAWEAQTKAYIQEIAWAGIGYRSFQSGMTMIGFNFTEKFSAAYTYEFSMSRFQQFAGSSHEIILGMRLNNFKKENQYTW
ncbi:MAG TPA: type IX secretion system membrane protein PorP/SprF [Chryseosolibacter sp.]|nr:type IX secretion system membrane protein PorP/SprF [Chryseosolibacter sp.]